MIEYYEWLLLIVAFSLIADSVLSLTLGKRYMLWGLGPMPTAYRSLVERLSNLPPRRLLALKLFEVAVGIALLFAVLWLI